MGRVATGVRGIRLREGDAVVGMAVVDDTATLLTVCENGFGKRTEFAEHRCKGRGGQGVINIKTTERNGKVVGLMTVRDEDEIMMITAQGRVIRTAIRQIRAIGRNTQGVTLINCEQGDRLVAIARVAEKDNGEGEPQPEPAQAPEQAEEPEAEAPTETPDESPDSAPGEEA
jgi:DNA gyrase subunit A